MKLLLLIAPFFSHKRDELVEEVSLSVMHSALQFDDAWGVFLDIAGMQMKAHDLLHTICPARS